MCADLKAGGRETTGQEAEVCKVFLCDCGCRQLPKLRKSLTCRGTDRQWVGESFWSL